MSLPDLGDADYELNLTGNFLLNLYHRSIINEGNDYSIEKSKFHEEYKRLVSAELRRRLKNDNVEYWLKRFNFLGDDDEENSSSYVIKLAKILDFQYKKRKQLDLLRIVGKVKSKIQSDTNNLLYKGDSSTAEEDDAEFEEYDDKSEIYLKCGLKTIQQRKETFCPTNMSCYICQETFPNMSEFEEHIERHNSGTDFLFPYSGTIGIPIFTMSYSLRKNKHSVHFQLETFKKKLIIEKIIILQPRSFLYANDHHVPYECFENGKNSFYLESHLFNMHADQSIFLVYHAEESEESRIIEEHYFKGRKHIPEVNTPIVDASNLLPMDKLFKPLETVDNYLPPKAIRKALKKEPHYENLLEACEEFRKFVENNKILQPETISKSLIMLLQIEEVHIAQEYACLTQKTVMVADYLDDYCIELPYACAKNVLSAGDEIVLIEDDDMDEKEKFVGVVLDISGGRIVFRCYQDDEICTFNLYTVTFRPSRINFRHQYFALNGLPHYMYFLKEILFPADLIPKPLSTISINLYNESINPEQLEAIRNIAEGPRNDAPYIIFGPPGTGKTMTVVEAILQVLKRPDTKIVVTASSNAACDVIALRLCKYLKQLDQNRIMVRIYSHSFELRGTKVDDDVLQNSNMYNGQFYPDIEVLHEYRIVICTLSVAGRLATGGFGRRRNHRYTHLFIDEAAASMEAEALMGIVTILTPKACLIISGDDKQLGPVVQSQLARDMGLGNSLMDRLLLRDCYRVDPKTGDYDRTIQTRLVRNYRSHPAIVELFSKLYYDNSLKAVAKPEDVALASNWHKLPNKKYPIIFHGICGDTIRDRYSHSVHNPEELKLLMEYVQDLMYFGINGKPVKQSDIGIISPYRNQYKRIQEELNLRKWFEIEAGSVETFQGKEKNIIIVSFVRSKTGLGFLKCPRRLNVAISRAKSLLILIGNPKTLKRYNGFQNIMLQCQVYRTFIEPEHPELRDNVKESHKENLEKMIKAYIDLNIDHNKVTKRPAKRRRCKVIKRRVELSEGSNTDESQNEENDQQQSSKISQNKNKIPIGKVESNDDDNGDHDSDVDLNDANKSDDRDRDCDHSVHQNSDVHNSDDDNSDAYGSVHDKNDDKNSEECNRTDDHNKNDNQSDDRDRDCDHSVDQNSDVHNSDDVNSDAYGSVDDKNGDKNSEECDRADDHNQSDDHDRDEHNINDHKSEDEDSDHYDSVNENSEHFGNADDNSDDYEIFFQQKFNCFIYFLGANHRIRYRMKLIVILLFSYGIILKFR